MTREDLERRLEAAEKQNLGLLYEIKNLKAQLADMQDEPEIPDMPDFEMDEKFYYLDSVTDDVEDSCHDGDIDNIDFNMFHTKEYADEFADKCKLIAMMLHCKWYLCRDYKEDFEDAEYKWYVHYTNNTVRFATACFATDYCVDNDHGSVYFDTEENAQKCADWLNEHWKENADE